MHKTLVGFIVGGGAGGSSNRFNFTLIVSGVSTAEITLLFPVHLLEAANKEGIIVSDYMIVSYSGSVKATMSNLLFGERLCEGPVHVYFIFDAQLRAALLIYTLLPEHVLRVENERLRCHLFSMLLWKVKF